MMTATSVPSVTKSYNSPTDQSLWSHSFAGVQSNVSEPQEKWCLQAELVGSGLINPHSNLLIYRGHDYSTSLFPGIDLPEKPN